MMLTAEGCAARRARLWDALPAPCDALVVGDPQHLVYFANFAPSPFTFRTADAHSLLVLAPGKATLVADNLLGPFAAEAHVDAVAAPTWYEGKASAPHRQGTLLCATLDALRSAPGRRVGVESGSVPAGVVEGLRAARPDLELVDLDPIIRPLKRRKDADEVALIERSLRAIEAGMAAALADVRPGLTEFQAYQIVERASVAELGERAIVYGDFVSGPRSSGRIGPPTHRVMEQGDLLILDFSVVVRGYRGDVANTLSVGGNPTSAQSERHALCLEAMSAGEALLRPGVPARSVYDAVRDVFVAAGRGDEFRSHAGHGVGLGHPEPPYFVPESTDTIELGDVVTLEPGLYSDELGGMRFERNYRIVEGGHENLSRHALTLGG